MDLTSSVDTLLAVAVVGVLAPLILAVLPGPRIPQVVLLLVGGMIIGPQVLDLGTPESIQILADVGIGFVFLLAGYEVDVRLFARHEGRTALLAWAISLLLAIGAVAALVSVGFVRDFVPVALALTTTALGTLLPILRENDMLRGNLGSHLLAAGAVGELLPILGVAIFLGVSNRLVALGSLAGVLVLALLLAAAARLRGRRVTEVVSGLQHETNQITLRLTVLLLLLLIATTDRFHLDAVLGAFAAGMVLRRWSGVAAPVLEGKMDAVAYGFFVPIFFVYSGMVLDLRSIAENPARVLVFFGLIVAIRGVPALLVYRGALDRRERVETLLITATTLPLLVALTEIGRRNGVMLAENAAALVGAGMLTVLFLPAAAVALHRRGRPGTGQELDPADRVAESGPGGEGPGAGDPRRPPGAG
ncbi:MAG: cation:proton antiporter [Pseudonocardia sp.]